MKFNITTGHPLAVDSTDHLELSNSNCVNENLVTEVISTIDKPFSILDFGCAGGSYIMEYLKRGFPAVGLDGTDQFPNGRQHEWPVYHNKNLFVCDASKPFTITNDGSPYRFDVITTFEFFEHIKLCDTDQLLRNMHNHITEDGFIFGSVSTSPDGGHRHPNIRPKEEWYESFGVYFDVFPYPFTEKLRDIPSSFYVMLKPKKLELDL